MSYPRHSHPPSRNGDHRSVAGTAGSRPTDQRPDERRLIEEANALLKGARLHGGDVRWLSGALVDVMISPVRGDDGRAMVVTVLPRHAQKTCLAGAEVRLTDADGLEQKSSLDDQGHARLNVPAGWYELSLQSQFAEVDRPPTGAGVVEAPTLARSAPCGDRRRPATAGRRRNSRRPSRSRRWAVGATVGALLTAAVPALLLLRSSPAIATVDLSKADCADTAGRSSDTHVVVAATWAGEERKRFRKVLERFEKTSNIDVTFATNLGKADRDLDDTLNRFFDQRCPPDVALLPQPALLQKLVREGHARPLDDIAGDLITGNYSSQWQAIAQGPEDGRPYGVWFKAADKSIIWYDVEDFEKAGITSPPATWEDLKAVAARLLDAGITPFSVAGEDGWTLTDWFENVYLRMWGPDYYNRLTTHDTVWTDPTVSAALTKLAEIFGRPELMAGGTTGALATTYEESVRQVFGESSDPETAMVFEGGFVANHIAETDAEVGSDAKYFNFPSIDVPDRPPAGLEARISGGAAAGGGVAALLNDTPAARELIRFLATPEAAEPWVKAGGFLSPNTKVSLGAYPDDVTRESAKALLGNQAPVLFDLSDLQDPAFGAQREQGMWPILRDFLAEPRRVDDTTARLEAAWQHANRAR